MLVIFPSLSSIIEVFPNCFPTLKSYFIVNQNPHITRIFIASYASVDIDVTNLVSNVQSIIANECGSSLVDLFVNEIFALGEVECLSLRFERWG